MPKIYTPIECVPSDHNNTKSVNEDLRGKTKQLPTKFEKQENKERFYILDRLQESQDHIQGVAKMTLFTNTNSARMPKISKDKKIKAL